MGKLRFYWWERISADGLRAAGDLARWPFPPTTFDVYWVGSR